MLIIVTLQQINYCYDCALRLGFYFEALYRKLCVFLWLPLCWSLPRQLEPDRWTMALTVLLLVELGLYASCFVCGIVTAASITIVQVTLLSKKKKYLPYPCFCYRHPLPGRLTFYQCVCVCARKFQVHQRNSQNETPFQTL